MNLRSRLDNLRRSGELAAPRPRRATGMGMLFPGEEREVETPAGPCYLREVSFPLSTVHGRYVLEQVLDSRGDRIALLSRDPALERIEPARSLFLDTETTGLAGGTGTWAFLIGAGWVEGNRFRIRQYFLRRPPEERAMLLHFTGFMKNFDSVVTFNGKAFDLPLIQTRQILAGVPSCAPPLHIDLLSCSRRLWKGWLPSCRLSMLESSLLGLQRTDDLPGHEIPAVYFDYLRRGHTGRLKTVFRHNLYDLLSMVTLLTRLSLNASGEGLEHPWECYALGRLHLEAGQPETGMALLRIAAGSPDRELRREALLHLAAACKRASRWEEATAAWHELLQLENTDPAPCLELAKYYEHRCGDFQAALPGNPGSRPPAAALRKACLRRRI